MRRRFLVLHRGVHVLSPAEAAENLRPKGQGVKAMPVEKPGSASEQELKWRQDRRAK